MDGRYLKTVIECKKWRSFIKTVIGKNITVLSKIELNVVLFEYGGIVYYYEISNGIYDIDDVWNPSDDYTGPDKKT